MTRNEVVAVLAEAATTVQISHPTRIAVDGRSAAGKSTLADELAEAVQERGRAVIRASIDDFHRPGHKYRSQRGGWTPQTYYDEGYDYSAFRELLLQPLGPDGSRRCRTALFNSLNDVWLPEEWLVVSDQSVAIIDGVFLLRPEIADQWDYVVWLDIDMETMVQRARRRDAAWVGSEDVVEDRYRRHWIPTHQLYERLADPQARAHAIIEVRNHQEPKILRLLSR